MNVWSKEYCFQLENAGGNGNIPARYQDKYQNGAYDLVLVFCDTDRKPYEQYADIKRKINEFHGVENAAEKIMIYGNPCTMQIIIEHWGDVRLCSNNKEMTNDERRRYVQDRMAVCEKKLKTLVRDSYLGPSGAGEAAGLAMIRQYVDIDQLGDKRNIRFSCQPLVPKGIDPYNCNFSDFFDHKKCIFYCLYNGVKTLALRRNL